VKLLWAVSNWKRTGPLEPSLDLAAAVARRGHEVWAAVGRTPRGHEPQAEACAGRRGLPLAESGARLAKHAAPLRNFLDARRLRRWLADRRPDACVATLRNDHVLLLRAAGGVPVVRLWFGDGTQPLDPRDERALRASAGALVFCRAAAAQVQAAGLDPARVVRSAPPLDVEGLRARADDPAARRRELDLPEGRLLVGIVARLQRHRRFEVLWDALALLRERDVPVHVLVVGRGTWAESVAHAPVRALGLEDRVTFAGYLRGRVYATTLAALDAQVLLVPGSDPTCRALREGMALGVPAVATRRGMLEEIVADGETGLLVDEEPAALAAALERLAADRAATRALGDAARTRAASEGAAPVVAAALEALLAAGVA
jgi:glycosyltransferase involved in cell wall biosynthesis